jgi:hypothetical protein
MKRTFATTTLAVALFGVSACKGGATADAVKLIPDSATVIGGMDMKAITSSKLYTDNKAMLEQGEGKEVTEAARACNLGPEAWKSVVFGFDPKSENMAIALAGDAIGKKENLDCIAGKMKEKAQKDVLKVEEKEGKITLTADDGKMIGYVVNDGTIVMASQAWSAAVKELVDGKGKAAIDGNLKNAYGQADTGKTFWIAGSIPADMVKGSPVEGAQTASASLDMSKGVGVQATVAFDTAENAKAKGDELTKQWEGMKSMAGSMGVPQTVVDSVKIEVKDTKVSLSASASEEDVSKLAETAKKAM